jgi:hypothetical protein
MLFNTTRSLSGRVPKHRTITMDEGVADTARGNTTRSNTGR